MSSVSADIPRNQYDEAMEILIELRDRSRGSARTNLDHAITLLRPLDIEAILRARVCMRCPHPQGAHAHEGCVVPGCDCMRFGKESYCACGCGELIPYAQQVTAASRGGVALYVDMTHRRRAQKRRERAKVGTHARSERRATSEAARPCSPEGTMTAPRWRV